MFRNFVVAALTSLAVSTGVLASSNHLVDIYASNVEGLHAAMEEAGLDLAGRDLETKRIQIVIDAESSEEAVSRLGAFSKRFRFLVLSVEKTTPYREKQRGSLSLNEDYFDTSQAIAFIQRLETDYPAHAKVFSLTQMLGLPQTYEGNEIYALQVSDNPEILEDEPKYLVVGMHHARELPTVHAVLDSAEKLLQDANGTSMLTGKSVWFVPVVNPDGLDYVFTDDRMWRKSRRLNEDGSRGVDLNRNYEFKWGACGRNSSSPRSDIYKGVAPNSEPEVQAMHELNKRLKAQFMISYHCYGNEVLYLYRCGTLAEPYYNRVRDEIQDVLNFGRRVASSSGEDFEHHYAMHGTISFLIELGTSFQPRFSHYRDTIWPKVAMTTPYFLGKLSEPHLKVRVTDSSSGEPLNATLDIEEITFMEGEVRETDSFGVTRWYLQPGTYNINAMSEGYESQRRTFEFDGSELLTESFSLRATP